MAGVLALLGRAGDLGRARGPRALVPVVLRMPAVALDHAIANLSIKSWFPGGSYEGERVITVLLAVAAIVTVVTARTVGTGGASPRKHEGHGSLRGR